MPTSKPRVIFTNSDFSVFILTESKKRCITERRSAERMGLNMIPCYIFRPSVNASHPWKFWLPPPPTATTSVLKAVRLLTLETAHA